MCAMCAMCDAMCVRSLLQCPFYLIAEMKVSNICMHLQVPRCEFTWLN
jgi:hypothetical protein